MPDLQPMMAVPSTSLPVGPEWSYEVKWDGYRALAHKRGQQITLRSRNLKDFSLQYPSIVAALRTIDAERAVIDGEIVALDGSGRPTFQGLHHRSAAPHAIVFYAFDLLALNGRDLTREPLDERRKALASLVAGSKVLLSSALPGTPKQIVDAVKRLGLEGVVAKRRQSIYEPGRRSGAWVKVRFNKRQEFVIGGFKPSGDSFDSLVVGYFDDEGRLLYAGRVRAGFTPAIRKAVHDRVRRQTTKTCPFADLPNSRTSHWGEGLTAEDMKAITWVKPKIVAELAFTEWTRDGSLRHSSFLGLREDKSPEDVRRET